MKIKLLLSTLIFTSLTYAQTTFNKQVITSQKVEVINPADSKNDFQAQLINLEAPSPDGDSYRAFLAKQKIKSRKQFPQKAGVSSTNKTNSLQPILGKSTRMYRISNGNYGDFFGGIPNDNALAVSDSGIVLCAVNSAVWGYDSNTDTTIFENFIVSLRGIGGGSLTNNDFDPKLIYDEDADRFILVYLQNNLPTNSRIKVCFSSTNDPTDPWYSYVLPGNPLNNNRWTDYPAISLTKDELFITGNLIIPGVSWQVGFDGSVIWQIDKFQGFAGDSVLTNTLYSQIKHDGKYTRNMHPVRGAAGIAENSFFLSNRNFDITNDTIFVLQVTGTQDDHNSTLTVKAVTTDVDYGMPPNGRQADTDLNDPTKGLQTNDARVLGAFSLNNQIQFVSNTINPTTGYAAIYHGIITDPIGQTSIKGNIISHPARDYGYPNIAWTGDEDCDIEALIGFNFTSPTDFPGVGTVYFANDSSYSDAVDLKNGENYTDRHSDSYERWGDYFGIQRKANDPKNVWMAGYFGNSAKKNTTWIAEVFSPDSNHLHVNVLQEGNSLFCTGKITLNPDGGTPPYQFSFNNEPLNALNIIENICGGDTIDILVEDARGCQFKSQKVFEKTISKEQPAAFPNPFSGQMVAQFVLSQDQTITATIYDELGRMVSLILDQPAKKGLNEIIFTTHPLASGNYILRIEGSAGFSMEEKIVKVD